MQSEESLDIDLEATTQQEAVSIEIAPGSEAVTIEVGKTPSVIRVDSVERAPLPVRDRLESYPEEELSEAAVVKLVPEKEHEVEELPEELVDRTLAKKIQDVPVDRATKKEITAREAPEEVSQIQPLKRLESMTEEELKEAVSVQLTPEDVFEAEDITEKQPTKLRPQESVEEAVTLDQVDTLKASVIRGPAEMAATPSLPSRDKLGLVTEEAFAEATTKEYIPEDIEEAAELPEEVTVDVTAEEIPEVSVTVEKVSKEKPTMIEATPEEIELTIRPGPDIDVVYERTEYLDKVEEEDLKEASTQRLAPENEGEAEEFLVGGVPKATPQEVPGEDLSLERVSKLKPLPVRDAPEEVKVTKTTPKLDSYEEEELQEAAVVTVAPEIVEEYEVLTTEETEEYSPEKSSSILFRASKKQVPLKDAPEEVDVRRPVDQMDSVEEEDTTDTTRRKPVVISHPYEPEEEYVQTREMLEVLPEEELETALTARLIPRDEFKAEALTTEEVSPFEATSEKTPFEVSLGVERKPLVQSMPGKEEGPDLLEEMEEIEVEDVEEHTAEELFSEQEDSIIELPAAPVILHRLTNKVNIN